jgi:hypothetical protein
MLSSFDVPEENSAEGAGTAIPYELICGDLARWCGRTAHHPPRQRLHPSVSAGGGGGQGAAATLVSDRRRGHCHQWRRACRVRSHPSRAARRPGGVVRFRSDRAGRPRLAPFAHCRGIVLNEHYEGERRHGLRARLQTRLRRRRLKAACLVSVSLIMKASLGGNLQGSPERMRRLQTSNPKRDILPHDVAATLATAQLGLIAKQPRKRHVRRSAESRT